MIILFILVFIAGAAKGAMDTLQFHYSKSIFNTKFVNPFWDASISWRNKYSDVIKRERKKWHGIIIPVLFLDGWHLFQSIFLTTLFLSIIFYKPIFNYPEIHVLELIFDYCILRTTFGLGFTLFYNKILLK